MYYIGQGLTAAAAARGWAERARVKTVDIRVADDITQITQITEISLTWDHKSSFVHSKVVSVWGLRP